MYINLKTMKNPKEIKISTKGVVEWEEAELLEWLTEFDLDAEIEIENKPNTDYILVKTRILYYSLQIMIYLENGAWDWKDIYEPGTFKEPIWIGIEIDSSFGIKEKICLGVNQEDGTDFSMTSSTQATPAWFIPHHNISIKYGENKRVFDDNNELN
jgi:hypothetical protein